jgi:hypothetical protein
MNTYQNTKVYMIPANKFDDLVKEFLSMQKRLGSKNMGQMCAKLSKLLDNITGGEYEMSET